MHELEIGDIVRLTAGLRKDYIVQIIHIKTVKEGKCYIFKTLHYNNNTMFINDYFIYGSKYHETSEYLGHVKSINMIKLLYC